jgi:methionyl-tRNA formyltransferase
MKAVVFAYHDMGITGLEALKRAKFEIQAIFTHQDDPRENCWFASVADWGLKEGIDVFTPDNVNDPVWISRILKIEPDIFFSFYYRYLLSDAILKMPRAGAFNLHGSFLPAYRGRAPVNWAIINGEEQTGVTLHYMVAKADAGDIVCQKSVPITFEDTVLSLFRKLLKAADLLLLEALPLIKEGRAPRIPQDLNKSSYYGRRLPEDGRIDWQWSSKQIYNLIRGVTDPYPGAFALMPDDRKLVIWRAVPEAMHTREETPCGTLRSKEGQVHVKTGDGWIRLIEVELSGKRAVDKEIALFFDTGVTLK